MNRRDFTLALAALSAAASAQAQLKKPEAGDDYLTLDTRAPTEAPAGKIEVVEFFWYNCPHCNAFEPRLATWAKALPKDVYFRRVPVAFRDEFVPQQRLYYALEALGRLEDLHAKVFYAIHVEHQRLDSEETIMAWIQKNGVNAAKFREQFNSFNTSTKARKATQVMQAYKVEGVPALGVAGRYYTDGSLAKNMERATQVADYLVAEARRSK